MKRKARIETQRPEESGYGQPAAICANRRRRNCGQTILKTAGELFLEQGYDGFSMRHLAQQKG
jgi:AcrR family transcriptional regulator